MPKKENEPTKKDLGGEFGDTASTVSAGRSLATLNEKIYRPLDKNVDEKPDNKLIQD